MANLKQQLVQRAQSFAGRFETRLEGKVYRLELFANTAGGVQGWLTTQGHVFPAKAHMSSDGQSLYGVLLEPGTDHPIARFKLQLDGNQLRLELAMPEQESLNLSLFESLPQQSRLES